jgi:hypothetical protein
MRNDINSGEPFRRMRRRNQPTHVNVICRATLLTQRQGPAQQKNLFVTM